MKNKYKRDAVILYIGITVLLLCVLIGLSALYYGIWVWAVPTVVKIILTCIVTFVTFFIGLTVWVSMGD